MALLNSDFLTHQCMPSTIETNFFGQRCQRCQTLSHCWGHWTSQDMTCLDMDRSLHDCLPWSVHKKSRSHYNHIDPHMLAITTHASEGMCACEASNITPGDVSNWVETDGTPTRRLQVSSSVSKQAKTFTYFWLSSRSSKQSAWQDYTAHRTPLQPHYP